MKLGGLLLLLTVLLTLNTELQAAGICVMDCHVDEDCGAGEECINDGCGRVCSPAQESASAIIPAECCLIYATRRIPRKFVDDYYETSSSCSKPGIIFHTKRGRKVCADPKEPWVQEYITVLELSA